MPRPPYAKRIRAAREASRLEHQQLATEIGISKESYYDLESYDDELAMCVSIKEVRLLANALGVSVWELVAPNPKSLKPTRCTLQELRRAAQHIVTTVNISPAEFARLSGWDIATLNTDDPATAWNLDCMRDLARFSGVNWLSIVSGEFEDGV